jgi:hypothetical protein
VDVQRQRLRFDKITRDSAPDGRCRVGVVLGWRDQELTGAAEGVETHHGLIRSAAAATLEAALGAVEKRLRLDLVGVKAVRAFDGWVVVVRVNGEADGRHYKLLGSASCEEEDGLPRAAALAVLDATNRVVERYIPES